MDFNKIREEIEDTIMSLERLAAERSARVRRRGLLPGWFPKRSDDPDEGSGGGSPAEGAGVPAPRLPRRPRRPPKTGRAGAPLQFEEELADAIATRNAGDGRHATRPRRSHGRAA